MILFIGWRRRVGSRRYFSLLLVLFIGWKRRVGSRIYFSLLLVLFSRLEEKGIQHRVESRIYFMRNLNNWIKSMLIQDYIGKLGDPSKLNILDLGCGKGKSFPFNIITRISRIWWFYYIRYCKENLPLVEIFVKGLVSVICFNRPSFITIQDWNSSLNLYSKFYFKISFFGI